MKHGLSLSDWLSIISLVVAVGGVAVALDQVRRVGSRARAAQEATRRQQRATSVAMLLARGGELERIEAQIHTALDASDTTATKQAIRDWRRAAADVQSILEAGELAYPDLAGALALSLGILVFALADLANPAIEPPVACQRLLFYISDACTFMREAFGAIMLSDN